MNQTERIEALGKFDTAVLADALEAGGASGVPEGYFHSLIPGKRMAGIAITLTIAPTPKGEKPGTGGLADAVEAAREREAPVLVISTQVPGASWGGCIGENARSAGVRGVVMDGAIRDCRELVEIGEQVFYRERTPASIKWRGFSMGLMEPVTVGGVTVRAGDFVVGDHDGVVIVPPDKAEAVMAEARVIEARELKAAALLREGYTFAEVLAMREAETPEGSA